jgi:hypothetical protein
MSKPQQNLPSRWFAGSQVTHYAKQVKTLGKPSAKPVVKIVGKPYVQPAKPVVKILGRPYRRH